MDPETVARSLRGIRPPILLLLDAETMKGSHGMMIFPADLALLRRRIRIRETALEEIVAPEGEVPDQRDPPVPEGDRTGIGARFVFPYSRR
jgi:hypothetical protein